MSCQSCRSKPRNLLCAGAVQCVEIHSSRTELLPYLHACNRKHATESLSQIFILFCEGWRVAETCVWNKSRILSGVCHKTYILCVSCRWQEEMSISWTLILANCSYPSLWIVKSNCGVLLCGQKNLEKFKNSVKSKDGTDCVKGRDELCSWYVACKDQVAWDASSVHEQVTIAGMDNIVQCRIMLAQCVFNSCL